MEDKKTNNNVKGIFVKNEEIYVGKDDEEVLNCDGEPCNFVIKTVDKD